MLSNTATPRFYGRFRDAVVRGEIVVNKEISMQMNRIDYLIANPKYYYDPEPVVGFIRFCESEMTLVDGSDLALTDTFKLWAEDLLGWYYFEEVSVYEPYKDGRHGGHMVLKRRKRRLINKQFLIVGRGAAKSLYVSCLQAYFLVMDPATTDQITIAPTMNMADEVLGPIRTAITRARGPLFKFLTEGSLQNTTGSKAKRQKLCSTKKGIQSFITNSILRVLPLSIDKLQGLRCKIATLDEWLSGDIREDPINAVEQGASKITNYVIVSISSEGTVRNGPGDDIKMELMQILRGEYIQPNTSIWYYRLDDVKEVSNPAMWIKANPNLGITVTYETYQRDVEKAEHVPSSRNDILAKRFGIPMEGYTYFFTYDETKVHPKRSYYGMPCALGADLSQGDDFCAFTFLFPLSNGAFGVKVRSYISSRTFGNLTRVGREKYQHFINEGSLVVMDGIVLNMEEVYDDLYRHMIDEAHYEPMCMGYDPYNAKIYVEKYAHDFGEFGVCKVPQGMKTETVPLGELKDYSEDGMLWFDEELMSFSMGNSIVIEDNNGNRKLLKARREQKIDNVSAMMDAYVAYKENMDMFI